jgi:hypothetical protein
MKGKHLLSDLQEVRQRIGYFCSKYELIRKWNLVGVVFKKDKEDAQMKIKNDTAQLCFYNDSVTS